MARSAKHAEPEIYLPSIAPHVGIPLLKRQIDKGNQLLQEPNITEQLYSAWNTLSEEVVLKAFGRNSDKHYAYLIAGAGSVRMGDQPAAWYESRRRKELGEKVAELSALISVLELEIEVAPAHLDSTPDAHSIALNSSEIFVVHGHDSELRNDTARFLQLLGLKPIVLHEQPNKGRTLIEKFTDHSAVGFAVVLLTPDDRGGENKQTYEELKHRARQNVIFELGFFLGKLGRNRVCALYREGVELPSDYAGVVYVQLDAAGAWRLALARELKSAGFHIDMNRAI
jgi:predicted nucleotide-binding protein